MRSTTALSLLLALPLAVACSKPTELASEKNARGEVRVAAAAPNTPPPDVPQDLLADAPPADASDGTPSPIVPMDRPVTVADYRAAVAADIAALPPVSDASALAAAFVAWKQRAAASPGAYETGQVQLGADPQQYRPSDAELVTAEAGDRLSAALQGADEATRAAVAAALGDAPDARTYFRFDYRVVDVMGSGRYFYASAPKEATLPL